jgi:hypothetical protein
MVAVRAPAGGEGRVSSEGGYMTTRYNRSRGKRRTLNQQIADNLYALSAMAPSKEIGGRIIADLGGVPVRKRKPAPAAVPAKAMPGASEAQVLAAVLAFLRHHPRVAWATRMNVGAMETDNGMVRFGFVGCSDIIGQMRDGRFLAIECKREKGNQLSDAQAAFLDRVRASNGVAGMARSVEDARGIVGCMSDTERDRKS